MTTILGFRDGQAGISGRSLTIAGDNHPCSERPRIEETLSLLTWSEMTGIGENKSGRNCGKRRQSDADGLVCDKNKWAIVDVLGM